MEQKSDPITFTVQMGSQPQAVDDSEARASLEQHMAVVNATIGHGARLIKVAEELGVRLRLPTAKQIERYGWRDGWNFVYEAENPDHDDVLLTRMIFNWRLEVAVKDEVTGYFIVAHWCFNDPDPGAMFVKAVLALKEWGGDPHSEPQGYIKKLDGRRPWHERGRVR